MYRILLPLSCILLFACQQTNVQPETFVVNETTSWTIDLPVEWPRLSTEEINASQERGQELILESTGVEIQETPKTLFNIQKDKANSIQANIAPFIASYGTFEEQENFTYEIVIATYEDAGMTIETESKDQVISGVSFMTFSVIAYKDDTKTQLIFYQCIWGALLDDVILTIAATTDSKLTFDEMSDWVNHSTFTTQ